VVDPGSGVSFNQKDREGIFVPSGDYGGFDVTGSRQILTGSPGTSFKKAITVYGSLILSNAFLECEGNVPAIIVKSGGRLLLSGCHISKADKKQGATDCYISVETGGFASINNCMFHGTQTDTGNLVRNNDALNPNRAAVVGCVNLSDVVTVPYFQVAYAQDVP